MKEQIKTPKKELTEMEISNLSDAECKTLVIRMLNELIKDLNSIKKIPTKTKYTLIQHVTFTSVICNKLSSVLAAS